MSAAASSGLDFMLPTGGARSSGSGEGDSCRHFQAVTELSRLDSSLRSPRSFPPLDDLVLG